MAEHSAVAVGEQTRTVSLYRLKVDVEPVAAGGLTPALVELLQPKGLHCGCGTTLHRGWLNTDVCVLRGANGLRTDIGCLVRVTGRWFYQHDLSQPLPIPDGKMPRIFAEHLVEHLERRQAVAWMTEMHRMLAPGGILRLSTPDLALYMNGYADPGQAFFRRHRDTMRQMKSTVMGNSRAWMVNQLFRYWGHEWIYDQEEIVALAESAGFPGDAVRRVAFREGADAEMAALDKEIRRDESIYVEITKPGA
ncbi:MAG: methyltransferase domain-containing protein [Alphaproteobacteria bacterium]|nr:methyltransferase domain-containing protein [Alphaproteobacteria bacterium]